MNKSQKKEPEKQTLADVNQDILQKMTEAEKKELPSKVSNFTSKLNQYGFKIIDQKRLINLIASKKLTSISPETIIMLLKDQCIAVASNSRTNQGAPNQGAPNQNVLSVSEGAAPAPEQSQSSNQKQQNPLDSPSLQKGVLNKNWRKTYPQALDNWCKKRISKVTHQPQREIKEQKPLINQKNQKYGIEITVGPISPIDKKRGDEGVIYSLKETPEKDKLDMTLTGKNPNKVPDYDYFYALVEAASKNGIDTIEFKNIKSPEFQYKLLAAAKNFKMKLINPPAPQNIDLKAEYIKSLPPSAQNYLSNYANSDKQTQTENAAQKSSSPEQKPRIAMVKRQENQNF